MKLWTTSDCNVEIESTDIQTIVMSEHPNMAYVLLMRDNTSIRVPVNTINPLLLNTIKFKCP